MKLRLEHIIRQTKISNFSELYKVQITGFFYAEKEIGMGKMCWGKSAERSKTVWKCSEQWTCRKFLPLIFNEQEIQVTHRLHYWIAS